MSWGAVVGVVLTVAVVYVAMLLRRMAKLHADAHLLEIVSAIPRLKEDALASVGQSPPVARILTSAPMLIAYSIQPDGDDFVHHLSLSTTVTPARSIGTFFLALLESSLPFNSGTRRVFVTKGRIFHLVRVLSAEAHLQYREAGAPERSLEELRSRTLALREELARSLVTPGTQRTET